MLNYIVRNLINRLKVLIGSKPYQFLHSALLKGGSLCSCFWGENAYNIPGETWRANAPPNHAVNLDTVCKGFALFYVFWFSGFQVLVTPLQPRTLTLFVKTAHLNISFFVCENVQETPSHQIAAAKHKNRGSAKTRKKRGQSAQRGT